MGSGVSNARASTPTLDSLSSLLINYHELEFSDEFLGTGADAVVRRATWHKLPVAVKLYLYQYKKEQFLREVSILSKLRHQNIVNILGHCTEPQLCIVVQLYSQGSLYNVLHVQKCSLSNRLVIKFAEDIARGMQHLHGLEIIHRDLKSQNVLVSSIEENEQVNCLITDFSISREQANQMTMAMGTPAYSAPELFDAKIKGTYTNKVDVFSFSILLWELWTRQIPYSNLKRLLPSTIVEMVITGQRLDLPTNCPAEYGSLIMDCWCGVPEQRPSFAEILRRLSEINKLISARNKPETAGLVRKIFAADEQVIPWRTFKDRMANALRVGNEKFVECLSAFVGPTQVRRENFERFLEWFPLSSHVYQTDSTASCYQLGEIYSLLQQEWFHGAINAEEAHKRLANEEPGTFLIRLSSSPGKFALSMLNEVDCVLHWLIIHCSAKYYKISDQQYNGLTSIVDIHRQQPLKLADGKDSHLLTKACPKVQKTN